VVFFTCLLSLLTQDFSSKNTVSILTQVLAGLAFNSMLWYIVGYSFVFGDSLGGGEPPTVVVILEFRGPRTCFPRQ
jgi:ammonia channel protein AmtB